MNSRILALVAAAGCLAAPRTPADYPGAVLGQSPLAYYRLNETRQPEANLAVNSGRLGAAADGVFEGAVVYQVAPGVRTGVPDGAVRVAGGGARVPASASLNPEGAFTAEVWVRPFEALSAGAWTCPMGSLEGVGDGRRGWAFHQVPGGWSFGVGDGAGGFGEVIGGVLEVGAWHHLVGAYAGDGTVVLYVNGVEAGRRTGPAFAPNRIAPLGLGFLGDGTLPFQGELDEAALYPTALSRERVEEHWVAGTIAPSTSYETLVRSLLPLGYWRLGDPDRTLAAANAGASGTMQDGAYLVGTVTGVPSLRGPGVAGFEPGNTGVELDGVAGGVRLPSIAPLVGPSMSRLSITAWVKPAAPPQDLAGLVVARSAGGKATGLGFSEGGQVGYRWDDTPASSQFRSGLVPPAGVWSFVVLVVDPEQAVIHLQDGTGLKSATNRVAHAPVTLASEVFVGLDPGELGRRYRGALDEVALWSRSLSPGEVLTQHAAAVGGVAARILSALPAEVGPVVAGTGFQLSVDAGGTPPLEYEWRFGGMLVPGANGPLFSRFGVSPADSGTYTVTVRNALGSETSTPARVTVSDPVPPSMVTEPAPTTRYVGGTARFYGWADGARPLRYQWLKDGVPIPGGTNPILELPGVQADADAGYALRVTNSMGAVTSIVARLTVLVPGPYAAEVMSDRPAGYWRLGESGGGVAVDLAGGYDGGYSGGIVLGQPGALSGDADTAARFDGMEGRVELPPALDLHSPRFTVEAWAWVTGVGATERTVLASREEGPARGYRLFVGTDRTWRFQTGTGAVGGWETVVGPGVVEGAWTHLAASHDGTTARLYVNGAEAAHRAGEFAANSGQPVFLGSDGPAAAFGTTRFQGELDDIGIYDTVLAPERIRVHHAQGSGVAISVGLRVRRSGGGLVVEWAEGVLQEAGMVSGPWTDVGAPSPWSVDPSGAGRFFRVRR